MLIVVTTLSSTVHAVGGMVVYTDVSKIMKLYVLMFFQSRNFKRSSTLDSPVWCEAVVLHASFYGIILVKDIYTTYAVYLHHCVYIFILSILKHMHTSHKLIVMLITVLSVYHVLRPKVG